MYFLFCHCFCVATAKGAKTSTPQIPATSGPLTKQSISTTLKNNNGRPSPNQEEEDQVFPVPPMQTQLLYIPLIVESHTKV
jgi:hypothetical protein